MATVENSPATRRSVAVAKKPSRSGSRSGRKPVDMEKLLRLMVEKNASDLFFATNAPAEIKIEGRIIPATKHRLKNDEVNKLIYSLMNDQQRDYLEQELEIDFAISRSKLGRFRANVFHQRGSIAMVLRYITHDMPRLDVLELPEKLTELAELQRGLILMVGASGSGKSTTLAAMVNHRNEMTASHIVTIEDPIEYLHPNKKSIVNQREVGLDTHSFAQALRSVVRAAPDVVLIGECRDRETMESALTLAGTGHLCIATLHANNAPESIDRIINMFPDDRKKLIFMDLSQYLRAIISQRLVPGRSGRRVAAVELMLNTPHMSELVLKGDVAAIKEALQDSSEPGMINFDEALYQLYREGRIDLEEALAAADSRANLEAKISFG